MLEGALSHPPAESAMILHRLFPCLAIRGDPTTSNGYTPFQTGEASGTLRGIPCFRVPL